MYMCMHMHMLHAFICVCVHARVQALLPVLVAMFGFTEAEACAVTQVQ